MFGQWFKSFWDKVLSFILFLLFLPIIILISFLIKTDDQGPVFFRQKRVGRNSKEFILFKFRTMIINAENMGNGVYCKKDDSRITRIGKYLRRYSLDEIPQLINIIIGDMSFIGPRPTLKYQVDKYNDHQKKRLLVKPGITGWAQVNGRNAIPWSKRIELDVWYIENWSLRLDLKIIWMTLFHHPTQEIYGDQDIFDL